jgi:hypothetical protein
MPADITARAHRLAILALPLLALFAAAPHAASGPPDGVSGRMVLDEVADGLRKCRAEQEPGKRFRWLERLAPTADPRVYVALLDFDYSDVPQPERRERAREIVLVICGQSQWWGVDEDELRRRAKELPR